MKGIVGFCLELRRIVEGGRIYEIPVNTNDFTSSTNSSQLVLYRFGQLFRTFLSFILIRYPSYQSCRLFDGTD